MAGIGFELRKLLQKDNLISLLKAYVYAGVISSGPWVLSIIGMVMIGFFSATVVSPTALITQFQVTITNIIGFSLILTGLAQLAFTRFIADRLFEGKEEIVTANYHAVLFLITAAAGLISFVFMNAYFPNQSALYRVMTVATFVVVCNIWVATVFLSGIKQYREIVMLYFFGYGTSVLGAYLARPWGLEGLLFGFFVGQLLLFTGAHALIARNFLAPTGMRFDVFKKQLRYPTLMWIGLFYNLGSWVDKMIFWYYPATSTQVIGPLRASVIYDFPVFLAYLSIIPGMAVFLVRIETDFVEHYDGFYSAVRDGGSLEVVEKHRNGMVETVRSGMFEMIKIQAIAVMLLFVVGDRLFNWLEMSSLYLPLLYVQTIAAGLQVLFLSILTVYFYLDRRNIVLGLCALLVVGNSSLTIGSLYLGPVFYGYGFALSMLLCVLVGFMALERSFRRLEYSTFMLQ